MPGLPTPSLTAKAELIDIVLMHVNGTAPGFEALCRQYTGTYIPCQYRSLGELRYGLRSIETNAPQRRGGRVLRPPVLQDRFPGERVADDGL